MSLFEQVLTTCALSLFLCTLRPHLFSQWTGLEPAGRHVVFKGGARKVPLAVGALDQPLGAGVQHVVLHHHPGDPRPALVQALDRILLAHVQVSLELVQRAEPPASLVLFAKKSC